ncbi:MAG: T9SS type A sorting domain-containing protein [Ferruginibacter sp.]
MKIKIYLMLILTVIVGSISISFKSRTATCNNIQSGFPDGATTNQNKGYTGASWDNAGKTCGNCHSGGTFGTTTSITLLSGGLPVTQYIPGSAYTVVIKMTSTSGAPEYSFNSMCVTSTTHLNVNRWGAMPANVHNIATATKNYVEQTAPLPATAVSPTSSCSVSLPWTAPIAGTGSVTFYAAGLAVDGDAGTDGDTPTAGVNLVVAEGALVLVKMSNVFVQKMNGAVKINWTSSEETNTASYQVERSADGIQFSAVGNVALQTTNSAQHVYNFIDPQPYVKTNYYRIVELDRDGAKTFSNTVLINLNDKAAYSVTPNPVNQFISLPPNQFVGSRYVINNFVGLKVATGNIQSNRIDVAALSTGTYALIIIDTMGNRQVFKFVKQ